MFFGLLRFGREPKPVPPRRQRGIQVAYVDLSEGYLCAWNETRGKVDMAALLRGFGLPFIELGTGDGKIEIWPDLAKKLGWNNYAQLMQRGCPLVTFEHEGRMYLVVEGNAAKGAFAVPADLITIAGDER